MTALVPCPSCSRHVRSSEAACPFCATTLPESLAARAVPSAPRRLERLAAFTFAASLAVAGCNGKTDAETGSSFDDLADKSDAGPDDHGQPMPMYGMPAPPRDDDADDGGVAAMYGMPAPDVDAGPPVTDDGGVAAMYGMPAPDTSDGGGIMPMYGMPAPND
jgi:hypothetical protein